MFVLEVWRCPSFPSYIRVCLWPCGERKKDKDDKKENACNTQHTLKHTAIVCVYKCTYLYTCVYPCNVHLSLAVLNEQSLVISKNGGDSDRLPTAHTCFNHLLLPSYSTKAKLRDRLDVAIDQSEGFGLR